MPVNATLSPAYCWPETQSPGPWMIARPSLVVGKDENDPGSWPSKRTNPLALFCHLKFIPQLYHWHRRNVRL